MSVRSLSKRVQTVVRRETTSRESHPQNRCPHAWTARFMQGSDEAARLMADITSRVQTDCPWWLREQSPRLHFEQARDYLLRRSVFLMTPQASGGPTDVELGDAALLLRLLSLKSGYEHQTGDRYPQPEQSPRARMLARSEPEPTLPDTWWPTAAWWPDLTQEIDRLQEAA